MELHYRQTIIVKQDMTCLPVIRLFRMKGDLTT